MRYFTCKNASVFPSFNNRTIYCKVINHSFFCVIITKFFVFSITDIITYWTSLGVQEAKKANSVQRRILTVQTFYRSSISIEYNAVRGLVYWYPVMCTEVNVGDKLNTFVIWKKIVVCQIRELCELCGGFDGEGYTVRFPGCVAMCLPSVCGGGCGD